MKKHNEIIRGLREDKDLSQTAIGKIIGCTQQQYSRCESGDRELSLHALMLLADFHEVSTDYLLGRTNRKTGMISSEEMITPEYSADEMLSDVTTLSPERRAAAVEFILFMKSRESAKGGKKKDGKRKN